MEDDRQIKFTVGAISANDAFANCRSSTYIREFSYSTAFTGGYYTESSIDSYHNLVKDLDSFHQNHLSIADRRLISYGTG